ncbi:hypothetical protein [Nesterenkonia sphaerica]|nr:hypothetical protein [Nesterenkonia sphaerica]
MVEFSAEWAHVVGVVEFLDFCQLVVFVVWFLVVWFLVFGFVVVIVVG